MEKRIIPVFQSESEEAQWWFDHRDEIASDMLAAAREGRNGIGSVGRAKLQEAAKTQAQQKQTSATH